MNDTSKIQSEAQLEESLIKRLGGLGYSRVTIPDEPALLANLKTQLESLIRQHSMRRSRKTVVDRVTDKIMKLVKTFEDGIGE